MLDMPVDERVNGTRNLPSCAGTNYSTAIAQFRNWLQSGRDDVGRLVVGGGGDGGSGSVASFSSIVSQLEPCPRVCKPSRVRTCRCLSDVTHPHQGTSYTTV